MISEGESQDYYWWRVYEEPIGGYATQEDPNRSEWCRLWGMFECGVYFKG